jgi:tetratricopeptide (TPR) repeat protein
LAKKGELDAALTDLTRVTTLAPKYAWGFYHRGSLYRRKGELDAALTDFETAIEIDPDFAAAFERAAEVHRERGNLSEACAYWQRAARIHRDWNRPERRREALSRIRDIDPEFLRRSKTE